MKNLRHGSLWMGMKNKDTKFELCICHDLWDIQIQNSGMESVQRAECRSLDLPPGGLRSRLHMAQSSVDLEWQDLGWVVALGFRDLCFNAEYDLLGSVLQ